MTSSLAYDVSDLKEGAQAGIACPSCRKVVPGYFPGGFRCDYCVVMVDVTFRASDSQAGRYT